MPGRRLLGQVGLCLTGVVTRALLAGLLALVGVASVTAEPCACAT